MGTAGAWAGVVLALLSFGWTEKRFRERRRGRLAVGQAPEVLRERLRQLASLFDEVLAQGGRVTAWFLNATANASPSRSESKPLVSATASSGRMLRRRRTRGTAPLPMRPQRGLLSNGAKVANNSSTNAR